MHGFHRVKIFFSACIITYIFISIPALLLGFFGGLLLVYSYDSVIHTVPVRHKIIATTLWERRLCDLLGAQFECKRLCREVNAFHVLLGLNLAIYKLL